MSFPNFTCVQCTRRLSRLAQSSKSRSNPIFRQVTPQFSHGHNPLFTTRHYSTRRVIHRVATRDSFARVRFTRADVPSLEFWEQHAAVPQYLNADGWLQAAQVYADVAIKNAKGWRERLIDVNDDSPHRSSDGEGKGTTLSAFTLHYVAMLIVLNRPGQTGPAGHLAIHILHTLSGLDYTPSTLTLVRLALARKVLGEPQFEPAVEALERILKRIGDGSSDDKSASKGSKSDFAADACTLRALMYESENTREGDNNALRWFRRAYEIGQTTASAADQARPEEKSGGKPDPNTHSQGTENGPFDPSWQWKASFALGVGRIRAKRGELEKARDMFAMASSELDNPDGYLLMADVLEKMGETDTDRYLEALQKAAVSGKQEAARKLGTREWDRAAEEGLSKWEKRKRQVVAEELMAVAGSAVAAER
ncbi:hypothetical protein F5Y12DRAFT_320474 [Xylaria sp. FL1777]|nr:hypothetical protein F5Y12DRAFT_320474 [Xylaria sp. FL1777]